MRIVPMWPAYKFRRQLREIALAARGLGKRHDDGAAPRLHGAREGPDPAGRQLERIAESLLAEGSEGMTRRTQLPWMASVKVGDVLRSASGTLRVVRSVARFKDGDLRSLGFAIRRGSWTQRPYTIMNFTDLRQQGFTRVGANYSMRTELDRRLARCIEDHWHRDVTVAEVRGIA